MKRKVKVIPTVLFLSVLIILVSCGKQKSEWKGTIEEEDGVIVVKNPKEPMYDEEAFSLEEELSIGEAEGREEYMFNQIRHIAINEDEKIYILDSRESHIKVFDKNGEYLRTIGKSGQGPGELYRPNMISLNQGVLMVHEAVRRLSFFSLDGNFLKNISTKEIWALGARIDSIGNIIVTEGVRDPENPCYILKKFDASMNLVIEIASSPTPNPRAFNPFMPIAYWLIDKDDNIIYGYPKDYELMIYNQDGEPIKEITKEYVPVEITEAEKEEETRDTPPGIKFDFSKYHSAYQRFFLDDEGRIFVQTWEKTVDEERYYHDVFDQEGRYIAKIPFKLRPITCKKGKLYSIEEDEEGYQLVKRYKVTWKY